MPGEITSKKIRVLISEDVEEVLKKEIVPIGNGAHVICPKEHIGKLAYLIIVKK
jgi:putative transposon-encoded protein